MNIRKPLFGLLLAVLTCPAALAADMELTTPDGRRVLLKADKTWQYVETAADTAAKDGKDAAAKDDKAAAAKKDEGEALLSLEGKIAGNRICRFQLKLVNNLPYEIRSLVPELSVYRANDVVYDSVFTGFSFLKPGDSQMREARFNGIACEDVARVRVGGGDRCEMGELDKFSAVKGKCLALVRVLPSAVVRFDK
jgi:hypothetical protein